MTPIKRPFEGANFAPESVSVMLETYEGVVKALGLTDANALDRAASTIIRLAAARDILDAAELRDAAIALLDTT